MVTSLDYPYAGAVTPSVNPYARTLIRQHRSIALAWIRQESVDNHYTDMVKPLSLLPGAMDAVYEMTMAISFGSSALTRVQEEAIATSVSVSNRCRY
jgi:hypothetical protein